MRLSIRSAFGFLLIAATAFAEQNVQLASEPDVSPDGKTLVFSYNGDIFRVATKGGRSARLTTHHANDSQPHYSPDGKVIAFISDRSGSNQVFVMNTAGGEPQQLTFHTEGFSIQDWYPDGKHLLVLGNRDHFWKSPARFMKISSTERSTEQTLFNDFGNDGRVSPDGTRIRFVREGERWWRKGYAGSRSAQIWLFDSTNDTFKKIGDTPAGDRSPAWAPDGQHFYYCSSAGAKNGARNLWQFNIQTNKSLQLTDFEDDLVATPTMSADGTTIVFSHLFDFYRLSIGEHAAAKKINIKLRTDDRLPDTHRRTLTTATDASFSGDGLEVAFISGGDL